LARAVRVCAAKPDRPGMHKKSPHLTALLKHWNKPRRRTKADKELIRAISDYPHNSREAVFCWLWDNHEGVHEMVGPVTS